MFRWLGALSTRLSISILLAAAALGVLGTLLTGSEPGSLLSDLIIAGSVIAALGIRRRSLYLLIPLPALTFFIGAVLTGAVKDSSIDTSKTELGVSFLQWIAGVFFAMCAATILVLVIGGARWLLSRQFVAGQFAMPADRHGGGGRARATAGPGGHADPDQRPQPGRDPKGPAPWGQRADPWGQQPASAGTDSRDPWGNRAQSPPARDSWDQPGQRRGRNPRASGNQQGGNQRGGNQPSGNPRGGNQQGGNQQGNRGRLESRDPWRDR